MHVYFLKTVSCHVFIVLRNENLCFCSTNLLMLKSNQVWQSVKFLNLIISLMRKHNLSNPE